jgi:hypothetical protein
MKIVSKGFTNRTLDNDVAFLNLIIANVEKIDLDGYVYIQNTPDKIQITIIPSSANLFDVMIEEVIALMQQFHIKVDFSKSMKKQYKIDFKLAKQKTP